MLVGERLFGNDQTGGEGRAFVYHGSAAGLGAVAAWMAESDQAEAYFGQSVSAAGDVNGDGFDDVIVGAPNYDNGQSDEGRAFVYHGSPVGLGAVAAWMTEPDQPTAYFGYSVSTAGDVNGDGFDDVIVGAWGYNAGEVDDGRAFVFHGSAEGLGVVAAWTAEGDQVQARFGHSVSTAGDVNGDGFDDVIIGAPWYNNGQIAEGRAFAYQGSAAGLGAAAAWAAEPDEASAMFGYSVSTAGDVDGDGLDDVVVGARYFRNGEVNEGRAFVYHGSATGLDAAAAWIAESDQADANFGNSVSTAGDVDGDGFDDVVVGAHLYDNGEGNEGCAFVYHGSAVGLGGEAAWTAESDQANAYFASSVATAGDVDGDSIDDVVIGAHGYDGGGVDEGRAFLYQGYACGADGDRCPGGLCRAALCDSGVCLIDEAWHDAGDGDPANECQACVPASDRVGWTTDADGTPCAGGACEAGSCAGRCFIAGVWWDGGVADPANECRSCVPAASTSSWTNDAGGTACAGGLCREGLCDGGSCLVGGVWRADGTEDPGNECRACDVASDRLAWTDDADGTVCVGGICHAGLCDGGSCFVDGTWYTDSTEDPGNECEACDVVRNPLE